MCIPIGGGSGHHWQVRSAVFEIPDLPPMREVLTLRDGTPVRGFDATGPQAFR
jgi:hypothetical protein